LLRFFIMEIPMKPTKAYILMIDNDVSREYAKCAADSCDKVGLPWEYFKGYQEKDDIWNNFPVKSKSKLQISGRGGACTAGHIHIWHEIAKGTECAVILEHDAIMLHKPDIEIPDDMIGILGYKVRDPENYNHEKAGPPKSIELRNRHGGAHAYAITPRTAQILINDIENNGLTSMVDNKYFLQQRLSNDSNCGITLGITDPICALGWLRKSTIWSKAAVDNYKPILESFTENYKSKEDLGLKNP
jgi:GR25 family glycosyltransferase involved in LPS biosynthesis